MMVVGDAVYALYSRPRTRRAGAASSARPRAAMAADVTALRNSIVRIENGEAVTEPFDLVRARAMYLCPVRAGRRRSARPQASGVRARRADAAAAALSAAGEPGGRRCLSRRVPAQAGRRSVRFHRRRLARPRARSVDLGRPAKLPRHARDRAEPGAPGLSRPWRECSGADPADGGGGRRVRLADRHVAGADFGRRAAGSPRRGSGRRKADVVTGAAFNDAALLQSSDSLDQYRVLHFATHGLVTAPRPDCPARPALVTSFAPDGSDGLLSFREIFDLKLDADVVILSACDTAGSATAAVSREAGHRDRRQLCARRAGPRLRRRRRAVGGRQPLAGARRL